jgi:hypothetical protein
MVLRRQRAWRRRRAPRRGPADGAPRTRANQKSVMCRAGPRLCLAPRASVSARVPETPAGDDEQASGLWPPALRADASYRQSRTGAAAPRRMGSAYRIGAGARSGRRAGAQGETAPPRRKEQGPRARGPHPAECWIPMRAALCWCQWESANCDGSSLRFRSPDGPPGCPLRSWSGIAGLTGRSRKPLTAATSSEGSNPSPSA